MIPKLLFPDHTANFIRALAGHGYAALAQSPDCRHLCYPEIPTRFDSLAGELEFPNDPEYLLACRAYDRDLILAAHESVAARADPEAFTICGLSIQWGKRMGRLRTWGGQQNLAALIEDRLEVMLPWAGKTPKRKRKNRKRDEAGELQPIEDDETPPSQTWKEKPAALYETAILGVSGIIPGHARVNGIDMGFSPNGTKIALNPWLELLALVGVEFAPIAVIPSEQFHDGQFAIYADGLWYPFFRRVRIEPYYYAWDVLDDRGLLPHQFAKLIDPNFSPGPFDDLQIPRHLLENTDRLWNEIERLKRIANREVVTA